MGALESAQKGQTLQAHRLLPVCYPFVDIPLRTLLRLLRHFEQHQTAAFTPSASSISPNTSHPDLLASVPHAGAAAPADRRASLASTNSSLSSLHSFELVRALAAVPSNAGHFAETKQQEYASIRSGSQTARVLSSVAPSQFATQSSTARVHARGRAGAAVLAANSATNSIGSPVGARDGSASDVDFCCRRCGLQVLLEPLESPVINNPVAGVATGRPPVPPLPLSDSGHTRTTPRSGSRTDRAHYAQPTRTSSTQPSSNRTFTTSSNINIESTKVPDQSTEATAGGREGLSSRGSSRVRSDLKAFVYRQRICLDCFRNCDVDSIMIDMFKIFRERHWLFGWNISKDAFSIMMQALSKDCDVVAFWKVWKTDDKESTIQLKPTQTVDFLEVIAGLILCCKATLADKINALFDVFDFDENEALTRTEMRALLASCTTAYSKMCGLDPTPFFRSSTLKRLVRIDAKDLARKEAVDALQAYNTATAYSSFAAAAAHHRSGGGGHGKGAGADVALSSQSTLMRGAPGSGRQAAAIHFRSTVAVGGVGVGSEFQQHRLREDYEMRRRLAATLESSTSSHRTVVKTVILSECDQIINAIFTDSEVCMHDGRLTRPELYEWAVGSRAPASYYALRMLCENGTTDGRNVLKRHASSLSLAKKSRLLAKNGLTGDKSVRVELGFKYSTQNSPKEVKELHQLFQKLDPNGTGTVDRELLLKPKKFSPDPSDRQSFPLLLQVTAALQDSKIKMPQRLSLEDVLRVLYYKCNSYQIANLINWIPQPISEDAVKSLQRIFDKLDTEFCGKVMLGVFLTALSDGTGRWKKLVDAYQVYAPTVIGGSGGPTTGGGGAGSGSARREEQHTPVTFKQVLRYLFEHSHPLQLEHILRWAKSPCSLSKKQQAELTTLFRQFDPSTSGVIPLRFLKKQLESQGHMAPSEIEAMMSDNGLENAETITLQEYLIFFRDLWHRASFINFQLE